MTARRDSRNVEGSISEFTSCIGSSPFAGVEDQSGKFAIMIEFVAVGIGSAMSVASLDDHPKHDLFLLFCFPGLSRANLT